MVSPMLGLDGETTSKVLNANSDDGMGESEGVEEIEVSQEKLIEVKRMNMGGNW